MNDISYVVPETSVIIDGNEYVIPERTEKIEQQLKKHDEKVKSVSQFNSDYELVEIILGKESAKKIFPKYENENLDRLHYIAVKLTEVYYQAYRDIEEEKYKQNIGLLDDLSDKVESISKLDKIGKK